MIYKSLVCFISLHLNKLQIPHFFIRSVNLLAKDPMTNREKDFCLKFFKDLQEKEIENIFSNRSKAMILIQDLRNNHYYFHIMGTIILILANILGVCIGAASYFMIILIVITLFILFITH